MASLDLGEQAASTDQRESASRCRDPHCCEGTDGDKPRSCQDQAQPGSALRGPRRPSVRRKPCPTGMPRAQPPWPDRTVALRSGGDLLSLPRPPFYLNTTEGKNTWCPLSSPLNVIYPAPRRKASREGAVGQALEPGTGGRRLSAVCTELRVLQGRRSQTVTSLRTVAEPRVRRGLENVCRLIWGFVEATLKLSPEE